MQSFTEDLIKVVSITTYRGVNITPMDDKFYVLSKPFDTIERAKEKIDMVIRLFDKLTIIK